MKTSKGEEKLIQLFKNEKINFKREICFEELNGKKKTPLRFDFGLYQNDKLFCLVEFDGRQHFEFVKYFHKNISGFKKQMELDRRKNGFCLINNIPLIRIPYWDLEELTLKKILTNSEYRVVSKYHTDNLIQQRCK